MDITRSYDRLISKVGFHLLVIFILNQSPVGPATSPRRRDICTKIVCMKFKLHANVCSFQVGNAIPVNVIMFAPAMFLGIIGGLMGATFTILNLKIARLRRRLIHKLKKPSAQKVIRFLEPPVLIVSSDNLPLKTESSYDTIFRNSVNGDTTGWQPVTTGWQPVVLQPATTKVVIMLDLNFQWQNTS